MAIANDKDCIEADENTGDPGNCGNYIAGSLYIIIYLVFSFLVIVNMYIAVILENYSQVSDHSTSFLDNVPKYIDSWMHYPKENKVSELKGLVYSIYSKPMMS